jgi:hypothetical protein
MMDMLKWLEVSANTLSPKTVSKTNNIIYNYKNKPNKKMANDTTIFNFSF